MPDDLKRYKEKLATFRDNILNKKNELLQEVNSDLISNFQKKCLNNLLDDISFYYENFDNYEMNLHRAWRSIIDRRFNYLYNSELAPFTHEYFKSLWDNYHDFSMIYGGMVEKIDNIFFSQQECTPNFKPSSSNETYQFSFTGKELTEVAEQLKNNPEFLEDFRIRVFVHYDNTINWVAANNRGLATIYLADLFPTRIIPDIPSSEERGRLNQAPKS